MSRRRKPMSPAKIAEREAQRKYDAAMREKAAPGPNIEALDLPANSNIEARKIGRNTYAKRLPWYDRVLIKNAPPYRAYERLLDLHAVAMGEDGGPQKTVGGGGRDQELVEFRRMRASDHKKAVLDRVGAQNRQLLELLITHPTEVVATWRAAVWVVFREHDPMRQTKKVRRAIIALSVAFAEIDSLPRW